MAINFPDPAAQTPVNEFGPTSTPAATTNGVTYTWDGVKWAAQADGNYATAAQGDLADTAVQPGDNVSTLINDAGYLTSAPVDSVNGQTGIVVLDADDISDTSTTNKFATQAELDKLAGIEAGATADQTPAEIKADYESNLDTNAFTDAEKTKLAGIAAGAEVNAVDSVAGKTGVVTLVKADITDFVDGDYATASQGTLADGAVQSTGDTMTGALGMPAGSAASPSVYFDANTGIHSPGEDQVAISSGGSERMRIGANGEIGLSGANYGTTGQVLQSNGSGSAPTWETPSGGSIPDLGTVGAYAFLVQNTTVNYQTPGTTFAGSSMRYSDGFGNNTYTTPPAGTWRLEGHLGGGTVQSGNASVFVRIA